MMTRPATSPESADTTHAPIRMSSDPYRAPLPIAELIGTVVQQAPLRFPTLGPPPPVANEERNCRSGVNHQA